MYLREINEFKKMSVNLSENSREFQYHDIYFLILHLSNLIIN